MQAHRSRLAQRSVRTGEGAVWISSLMDGSPSDRKATIVRYFEEGWHDGEVAVLEELCTTDHAVVGVPVPGEVDDRTGHQAFIEGMRHAFPDLRCTFDVDEMVADSTGVGVSWVLTGQHEGQLWDIEPTQRRITIRMTGLFYFEDEQVSRAILSWDDTGLLVQLGVDRKQLIP